jgi:triacylglycerol esterase/lipase EstA (alpha/beta hydrolase family)
LLAVLLPQVIEMCGKDPRLRQYCNCSKLLLMGHSRGAKLSCLIAEQVGWGWRMAACIFSHFRFCCFSHYFCCGQH